jgi:CDP-diacylglycerol--glycerol-3-phosphate 3-phosphatidyltransferase
MRLSRFLQKPTVSLLPFTGSGFSYTGSMLQGRVQSRWWRHTPNAISGARLLAAPVLLGAALQRNEELFKWLLLACLLSDILDGAIARVFHLRSRMGAFLDSTADMLVVYIALYAVYVFRRAGVMPHAAAIAVIAGLYVLEGMAALCRYGRISSFHTILVRVSAFLQGIFIMALFFWGFMDWIFTVMLVISVVAYVEELALVALLPEWKADVRGLYWVLRED